MVAWLDDPDSPLLSIYLGLAALRSVARFDSLDA